MVNVALHAVNGGGRALDSAAARESERLHAETNAKKWEAAVEFAHHVNERREIFRAARTGSDTDEVGGEGHRNLGEVSANV